MSFSSQNPHDPQHNPQGGQPNPQNQQPSYGGPTYGGANQPMQQPGQHQQPSYSAPQGGYTQPGGQPQGRPGRQPGQEKGFFAALFDFSFKNYITIKFASILYIAGIVLLTLGWFIMTVAAFATDSMLTGMATLILGLIVLFIYIVLFRLMLEFYVAMVRTAQNTSILVDRGNRL
ncbi:DUF4282 domain-containing protein [Kocuria palustris]|uniref:DUF4282 domain-containing protein n=1 Tax=Kocuria palustris TaxID=71999 RepID=UPI0035E0FBB3